MLSYATTFSGIGGWELGLNACGWELKWQCERDPFCQALLRERFGVPIYDDITTLLDHNPESVDALIGSPPCQPFSHAGEMLGVADERHLYPAFIRAVGVLKPRWVLMEQVPAIISDDGGRTFGQYVGGLAALGYNLVWHCIPGCALGADHERDRVWIIAHLNQNRKLQPKGSQQKQRGRIGHGFKENVSDTHQARFAGGGKTRADEKDARNQFTWNRFGYRVESGLSGEHWNYQPVLGRGIHGVPYRVDRIESLGNAVLPQIPYLIGQAINEIEGV